MRIAKRAIARTDVAVACPAALVHCCRAPGMPEQIFLGGGKSTNSPMRRLVARPPGITRVPIHLSRVVQARELHSRMRSEEHTSELQSRGLISYAVFCLQKK